MPDYGIWRKIFSSGVPMSASTTGRWLLAILVIIWTAGNCNAAEIEWKAEKRFRLLSLAENDRLESEWYELSKSEIPSIQRLVIKQMEQTAERSKALIEMPDSSVWYAQSGRYSRNYIDHRTEQVRVSLKVVGADSRTCNWSVAAPAILEKIAVGPGCRANIRVPYDTDIRAEVWIADNLQSLVANIHVKDVLVAAFGDSYSSGEGNPDVPAQYLNKPHVDNDWIFSYSGPAAKWWDDECHRSMLSWPVLAALKLSLEDTHNTVTLLNYSCSGAEVGDGIFMAQIKQTSNARNQQYPRDGLVAGPDLPNSALRFTSRSQINALREDLCGDQPLLIDRVISIPGSQFRASMETCSEPIRRPDFLVLTIGGNDIRFGPAVQGVLVPSQGKRKGVEKWMRTFVLNRARASMGIESVQGLGENALRQAKTYSNALKVVAEGAWVKPAQVVLVRYPNPIGSTEEELNECTSSASNIDIRNSFMIFGVAAHQMSRLVPMGWTVWLDKDELRDFSKTFPYIEEMQLSACRYGVRVVDPISTTTNPSFSDRRLCSPIPEQVREDLEARYFCQPKCNPKKSDCVNVTITECSSDSPSIRELKRIDEWRAYRPALRMVYSMNEAVLAQRSWECPKGGLCKTPFTHERLLQSLSGTLHLTAEMHAAAADSVATALQAPQNLPTSLCREWIDRFHRQSKRE
jgi:hypothetical protein